VFKETSRKKEASVILTDESPYLNDLTSFIKSRTYFLTPSINLERTVCEIVFVLASMLQLEHA
jgi:hypothetical protein